MAEIFGAVTGGFSLLSLALQLGESALKLNSICERVKDARTLLTDLSHDLETISLTMHELERHRLREKHDAALLQRCAVRCKEKADRIAALVTKLQERINRSRVIGKAAVALKRAEIEGLLGELEETKSSIILALHMYSL